MLHSLVNVDGKKFLVDKHTGEVLGESPKDGQAIWVKPRRQRDKSFVILMDMDLDKLASLKLSPTSWRLFYLLLQNTEFENWVHLNQAQMARLLKVTRQQIYTSTSQLLKVGLLRREEDSKKISRWRIDPGVAWRGSLDDQMKSLNAFNPLTLSQHKHELTPTESAQATGFNGKCPCGSILHSEDPAELDNWLELHQNCDFEMEEWESGVDQSRTIS